MRRRFPPLVAAAFGLLGLTTGAVWAATTSPPVTDPVPSPPSTTTGPVPTSSTSTTSTPPKTTTTTTTTTVAPGGGDAAGLTGGVIPPDALAEIAHFRITPPGDTSALLKALEPLGRLGLTPTQAAIIGFGRFPIAGVARWSDSFLEPRFTADGTFVFHHAIDIPAACDTPERAPDEGTLTQGSDPNGGTTVEITEPDGTYMYMAHLSGYAADTTSGQHVHVGDVVGYVGQTGAATGCHLHLEIHPQGGDAVDPKPFVDAWYGDALAEAPVLVDALLADHGLPSADTITFGLLGL
ncbi:MAG: M23 family metallopeptidase [Acidimicrobiales bacterium]